MPSDVDVAVRVLRVAQARLSDAETLLSDVNGLVELALRVLGGERTFVPSPDESPDGPPPAA